MEFLSIFIVDSFRDILLR